MKVILTQDVENLGLKGEVVAVKAGYGRNFLIPRGLALTATPGNVARLEEETRQQARKLEQQREDAEAIARRLDETRIVVAAPVGEEGRLFGTITTQQIAEELAKLGMEVDRRRVSLEEEIRTTGEYRATVRLMRDVAGHPTIQVVPESASEAL